MPLPAASTLARPDEILWRTWTGTTNATGGGHPVEHVLRELDLSQPAHRGFGRIDARISA